MKKVGLIKLLLGIGLAASGALALGSALNNKKAEVVEAGTTKTLYINVFDGGGTWNNFSYYLFGGSGGENAGWPGVAFTNSMKTATPNEYDQYQYKLTVDTSVYPKLILVGNPSNWGGSQAQTDNLVIDDMPNNGIYCGSQIPNSNKFEVGYYGYTTKTVYMLDLAGNVYNSKHYCHTFATGKSGTTWPGVSMTKVAGQNNLYSAEINSALGNVIFNNNGSNETATISSVSDGDSYIIYPDNGFNKTTLDAASFIDKYMKFETKWLDDSGTGQCKASGWYSSAKSAFSSKTSSQKSKILEHEPTKYRMQDWAKANGETFNISTGAFSSSNSILPVISKNNSNTVALIVIISLVSVTAIGGFFFIRKRKVN